MQIADITEDLVLMLPVIILVQSIVALVVWFAWGSKGGRGARFAAWLGLTTLTLLVGSVVAFIALHLLLFAFGNAAVVVGVAVTTLFMLAMPFGWAWVVRHHGDDTVTPNGGVGSQQR
jgi:hypothetical protein